MIRTPFAAALIGCSLVLPLCHAVPAHAATAAHDGSHEKTTPSATTTAEPVMKIVHSADGTPIATFHAGKGPPLLLVHGATSDHNSWALLRPLLEPHFEVWTMDRRGRGKSGDAAEHSLGQEADDILAVATAIGRPTYVLGHSYGGLPTIEAVLRDKSRFKKVAFYEAPLPPFPEAALPPNFNQRMDEMVARKDNLNAMRMFLNEVVRLSKTDIDAMESAPTWSARVATAPTVTRELRAITSYQYQPERVRELNQPVLLLVGGNSGAPVKMLAGLFAGALLDARTVVLEGHGHMANLTGPDVLSAALIKFFAE